ncbi:MAG: DNA polymerase III subunit gamma and tau [Candidatus Nanopelagicales bacterium]
MSLALYRTYRPSRLSEVIGQEHVTEPLRRALEHDRVHHAFLFSGPRGCGKTSTARILARSLLCESGPTPDPCGTCRFCEALAPTGAGLVDVIELDAASHGGVDDTRELRERAAFVPAEARYKIYIIDEAHMVSKDGFNALLKLIEEPPEHVKFIFATTEVDKVLPTIRSRTFNYTFRLVPVRQLQQNLAGICEAEGVAFEPAALTLIARASGGSVRDAQSIMGQLIAGAGPEGLTQAQVADQLGVTDEALLDSVVSAVADHDGGGLFAVVEQTVDSGHDVRRFVTDLLHRFRDLLVIHYAGDAATADMLDVTEDRREALAAQAARFGPTELTRYADVVNEGLTQVKGSTSPRLQLEVLAARLLVPTSDTDPEATLARLEVLERRMAVVASAPAPTGGSEPEVVPPPDRTAAPAAVTPPAPPRSPARAAAAPPPPARPTLSSLSESAEAPAPVAPAAAPPAAAAEAPVAEEPRSAEGAPAPELAAVTRIWPQLMAQVAERSRVAAATWEGAEPVSLADGVLTIAVPTEGQAKSISRSKRDLMLRTMLIEAFGIDVQVRAATDSTPHAPVADVPSEDDPDLGDDGGLTGVDLAMQSLGATKIGEIDQV